MKRWFVIILGILIGFVLVWGGFYLVRQREIVSPIAEEFQLIPTDQKLPGETLKEYQDASGFKFTYPEDLTLVEEKITDEITYADLKLTSKEASGSLSLRVVDSKLKSLDEWFKENKETTSSAEVQEINLADIKAKEIKKEDKIFTLALDQGALFTIELNPAKEKGFWEQVYRNLVSTFAFVPQESGQTKESQLPAAGGEIIFEGEEIIE